MLERSRVDARREEQKSANSVNEDTPAKTKVSMLIKRQHLKRAGDQDIIKESCHLPTAPDPNVSSLN